MKINKVYLKNIRSYKEAEIKFPEGSILLNGDIGSGKSTILLALEFALFGLQKGILSGASLLRAGENKGEVSAEIEIGGKKIAICRALKREKDKINQDTGSIIMSGKEENLSATELKSRVLKLLNYPPEFLKKTNVLYRYTVYTPQEEMRAILQEKPEERIDTIRRIFNIDKYKRVFENTEIFSNRLKEEIKKREGFSFGLEGIKREFETKSLSLNEFDKKNEKIKIEEEEKRKKVREKKASLNAVEKRLKEFLAMKAEIDKKKFEIKSFEHQMLQAENEFKEVEKELNKLREETGKITEKKLDVLKKEISQLEQKLPSIEEVNMNFVKSITLLENQKKQNLKFKEDVEKLDICPKCRQKITPEHRKKLIGELDSDLEEIELKLEFNRKGSENIKKKISETKEKLKELNEWKEKISLLETKMQYIREKEARHARLETLKLEIEEKIKGTRNELKAIAEIFGKLSTAEEEHEKLKLSLEQEMEEMKEIELLRMKIETEKRNLKNELKNIGAEMGKKEIAQKEMEHLSVLRSWLSSDFSDILNLIEKAIMVKINKNFSQLFRKWFDMLVPGLNARIDENFTPIIEQQGYSLEYDFLSGGERTAAALAYRLALNQIINSLVSKIKTKDLLILDEPTDGFSSEQLDKMRNVLDELKVAQLIIVSHEEKIEGFVSNIISLKKEGETTVVEHK